MQDAIILYENGKAIGGEGHPTDADDITFNNSNTDLVSENVEDAIKEAYGKSAKSADLTSISESGTTASQAISAGTYFYLNGTLVRAKTAIASGATFTLNTNYEIVPALNSLRNIELNTGGVRGRNFFATSHTIDGWSTFFCAIIVGFMDNVGGFIGAITGTTYTHIAGTNMTQNNRLTLSLSGSTLTLNGVSTFSFTFILH